MIKLTLDELRYLLDEQKLLVIEKLISSSAYYNKDSTEGHLNTLPIDNETFKTIGLEVKYPNDYMVLKKYLSE